MMGSHPEVVEKLREEMVKIFPDATTVETSPSARGTKVVIRDKVFDGLTESNRHRYAIKKVTDAIGYWGAAHISHFDLYGTNEE